MFGVKGSGVPDGTCCIVILEGGSGSSPATEKYIIMVVKGLFVCMSIPRSDNCYTKKKDSDLTGSLGLISMNRCKNKTCLFICYGLIEG